MQLSPNEPAHDLGYGIRIPGARSDIGIPLLSLLVALAGVLTSTVVQVYSISQQTTLKQYEVTFLAKQKAYAELMATIELAQESAADPSPDSNLMTAHAKMLTQVIAVQPFFG